MSRTPKHEEHFHLINNRHPFIDIVTKRKAYAYGDRGNCYVLYLYKHAPYSINRQDWVHIPWDNFPAWVRKRCEEVEPILQIMKPLET